MAAFFGYCQSGIKTPVYLWTFDNPESYSKFDTLSGLFSYTAGVSGQALVFDGYSTEIVSKDKTKKLGDDAFTLSAWIAPQEYSLNLSAIVNQQENMKNGYFFGINQKGQLVGSLSVNGNWETCVSMENLPLLKWSFVCMVYESKKGIDLYINGKKAGNSDIAGRPVYSLHSEINIGKTQMKMTPVDTERETSRTVFSYLYFDGLMDEVKIYSSALSSVEVLKAYANTKITNIQPLQYRRMPSGTNEPRPFGAFYTRLKYSSGWDQRWRGSEFPDVIVRFDNSPVKLVFWRGTGYIPGLVTENGIWMTDQSGENFGSGECYEAMGDKQCRYSHVRIIENTPARAVIHWRYALASISHKIMYETEKNLGDWMDEYWTAYPDGVIVRKQVLWSEYNNPEEYQFQETIFFNQPGTKPQDNMEYEAITFLDMDGNKASYSWENGVPKGFEKPKFKPIEMVNTKSNYKPFSIHHPERVTRPFSFGWVKGYSTFPCWNHWPVNQMPSDGRKAVAPDKPSHSSLTAVNGQDQKYEKFEDGSVRVRSIMGMTTQPIESVLSLARSWNNPPEALAISSGYLYNGYDPYQRAYLFEKDKGLTQPLNFELSASKESPVVNLSVVIKNWGVDGVKIEINGKNANEGVEYTTGLIRTLDTDDRVIWINNLSESKTVIEISPL